jgi:serine/threonine-protein kinase
MDPQQTDASEPDERLVDVIAAYLQAEGAGASPDRRALLARHADLALDLSEFFAAQDRVRQVVGPLHPIARAARVADLACDDTPTAGEPAAAKPNPQLVATLALMGYDFLEEIAQGGSGVVYKVRQRRPERVVALKTIAAGRQVSPEDVLRFRNEAETLGSLSHPNIVPLYEVREHENQLFLCLAFMAGGSLDKDLPRFREDPRAAARLMVAIARAVHHAHQHGVLHRDLKPSNILLDAEGQPHVTDFGLAKRVDTDASLTQSGTIVGTPRYMAPEQVLGRRAVATTATDFYGLGAILYSLLTGGPPFRADTVVDTLVQVRESEPVPPSRANPKVDRDLATMCLKCLEKEPGRRYASAEALAEDLERWLAGEPIQAGPLGRTRRFWRWCRRKPGLASLTAAAVVLALTLTAGIGWVVGERGSRQRVAEARVREALAAAAPGLQQGNPHDTALIEAVQRAQAELGLGVVGPVLRDQAEQLRRDHKMLAQLENARFQHVAGSTKTLFDFAGADRLYAQAFKGYGLPVSVLDAEEAARRLRKSAIRTHLVAALDDWAFSKDKVHQGAGASLRALANLADDNPWRQRLREAAGRRDRATLRQLATAKVALRQPPANLALLARALADGDRWTEAARLLRRAQAETPADFWINFQLGSALHEVKSSDQAEDVRFLQAALALRPHSTVVYCNLGVALRMHGKLAEAEAACRKAIALKPDFAMAHFCLGDALRDQRKLAEAEAAYRKVMHLTPDDFRAYANVGHALRDHGKPAAAEALYRKVVELTPSSPQAHTDLGVALHRQGKLTEADAAFRTAIDLKPDYGRAYTNLGGNLAAQGKLADAEPVLREAIRLSPDDAVAHHNLGLLLATVGRLDEAALAQQRAIEIDSNYAGAHGALGQVLLRQGRFGEAGAPLRRALELLAAQHPLRKVVAEQLTRCEQLLALEQKLAGLHEGDPAPKDAAEQLALADLCQLPSKSLYATAARFYQQAFAAKPALAEDYPLRYNAACAAALAGSGQGKDAPRDSTERDRLRRQALDWLRAELEACRRLLDKELDKTRAGVTQRLKHWLADPDFAGVRGKAALDNLPEAERHAWRNLWTDVGETLPRADKRTAPDQKTTDR